MSLLYEPAPTFTLDSTAGEPVTLTDTSKTGPTIILINRGPWCSYCAEQLLTYSELHYDLWRHHDATILPIFGDPIPDLITMRDRFNFTIQLLADPQLDIVENYTGIEDTDNHGQVPIAGTFLIDTDGLVQYEQIAENYADRTYANYARHLIKNEFTAPYESFEYTRPNEQRTSP